MNNSPTTPVTVNLTDEQIDDVRQWTIYEASVAPERALQDAVMALPDPTPERTEPDIEPSDDLLYWAWTLIANAGVHHGGWESQHPEWVAGAEKWRDAFHASLDANRDEKSPPERTEYLLLGKADSDVPPEVLIHVGDVHNGDRLWVDGEWRAVSEVSVRSVDVTCLVGGKAQCVALSSSLIVRPAGVS